MADPYATEKAEHSATTAAALATVYEAARVDVLRLLAVTGDPFRTLRRIWRDAVTQAAGTSMKDTAADIGTKQFADFDPSRLDAYLDKVADSFAGNWERKLNEALDEVAAQIDATYEKYRTDTQAVLDDTVDAADSDANELVDLAGNFAGLEAAKQDGLATKTWHDPGTNNRPTHQAMDGLTIPLHDVFPIGLPYPHAPGPASETVNCDCYLTFGR